MKRATKIPMTYEEFEIYDVPFGWKDEYYDGFAFITPRPYGVMMKMKIEKRDLKKDIELLNFSEVSQRELSELFFQSFVDSVEYLNFSKQAVKREAKTEIGNFFKGRRGIPQPEYCKVAAVNEKKVGACLISKYKYGFKNEILFVHPEFQGRGIGSFMLSAVLNDLNKTREKYLWSEHHICNEKSAEWYKNFGFVEVTDIMTAKFRLNYYRQQVYRSEKLHEVEKLKTLKPLLNKAKRKVDQLKKIEEQDFEAAWMLWRYDY